jgi:mRNA interferase RelE/StbE
VSKIDQVTASRILDFLEELEQLDNPRIRGKGLTGDRAGLWRYSVGDYRILVEIIDRELVVLAIGVGHRSRIYRD